LQFVIKEEYETGIVSWQPDKISFPSRKNTCSINPSLQSIEIIHYIVANKKHILTFKTKIHPKKKTVTSFVMKKELDFQDFDNIHIRINFNDFGGLVISKVETLILTGKCWSLFELQEFVILLPSLKVLIVDIAESISEEESIIEWVAKKFGPNFCSRKVDNSLQFYERNFSLLQY
jgi:hypothetical protein